MRKKHFYVIAYDIADDKRRQKIVKLLESLGQRVNYSVFECMLTDLQLQKAKERMRSVIVAREDRVILYPLCIDCYSRIDHLPPVRPHIPDKVIVV